MSDQPRIGITVDLGKPDDSRHDYSAAIARASGSPVLLHPTPDPDQRLALINALDGLLIPGGNDLDPRLYGQQPHPTTEILHPQRQNFELALLALAEQRQLPTLGICLGCQMMNVHRRGTLHQHLPDSPAKSDLQHSQKKDCLDAHPVTLRPGTALAQIFHADSLTANSRHHQAIDKLGQGLHATAAAPDGVIEAIEDPTLPFWIAVQWHPENLAGSPHDHLFQALVHAAKTHRHRPK